MDNKHAVAVTGIILQSGKYLITKRSLNRINRKENGGIDYVKQLKS